jgi:lysylphosphatidylglycerol synthetase-like protein (DUF2156 family)
MIPDSSPGTEAGEPSNSPGDQAINPAGERFFSSAIPRMTRMILIVGTVFAMAVGWRWGRAAGLGYGAGVAVAYVSFRSLYQAVRALASRIVEAHQPERGFSLFHGFMLRYLLAGGVAYVIFSSSSQAFRGFLFGLCTPVGALLIEAGFEAYVALRRGY